MKTTQVIPKDFEHRLTVEQLQDFCDAAGITGWRIAGIGPRSGSMGGVKDSYYLHGKSILYDDKTVGQAYWFFEIGLETVVRCIGAMNCHVYDEENE